MMQSGLHGMESGMCKVAQILSRVVCDQKDAVMVFD